MKSLLHEDKVFDKNNWSAEIVKGTEFQSCTFKNIDFSNSKFSFSKFIDCNFIDCNLSMIELSNSSLNNVAFKNCKMLGINFSESEDFLFQVGFESCILDYSSFMGKKMVKTIFTKTSLKEVNFTQANLSGSKFEQSDLSSTLFNKTDLNSVNFTTAYNYCIDPESNNIKKAIFSVDGLRGLLDKYNIKIV